MALLQKMTGIGTYPCQPTGHTTARDTGWRRLIGHLKLGVIFRKRATNYRALLRKLTYTHEASYGCSPPCTDYTWLFRTFSSSFTPSHISTPFSVQREKNWAWHFTVYYYLTCSDHHLHTHTYTYTSIAHLTPIDMCVCDIIICVCVTSWPIHIT